MTTITVIIADDHAFIRKGVRATLQRTSDIEILAETATSAGLVALCQNHCPTVLLLDIHMPGPPLADTLAAIRTHCPEVAILILSADTHPTMLRIAQQHKVAGYFYKGEVVALLAGAVRSVARGASWYSRAVLTPDLLAVPDLRLTHGLTDSELKVLEGIVQSMSNRAISLMLHIAEQTVRNYASHIYTKLGVASRTDAVVWALDHGVRTYPG